MHDDPSQNRSNRRQVVAGALSLLILPGAAPAKKKRVHTMSTSGVDLVRLIRPKLNVTLKLTAGGVLQYGTWERDVGGSNTKLQWEKGLWENWVLGSPGGGSNVRIYSPDKTKFLALINYTTNNTMGGADFILPDSGGPFGSDPAEWFRI